MQKYFVTIAKWTSLFNFICQGIFYYEIIDLTLKLLYTLFSLYHFDTNLSIHLFILVSILTLYLFSCPIFSSQYTWWHLHYIIGGEADIEHVYHSFCQYIRNIKWNSKTYYIWGNFENSIEQNLNNI